ncbi:hypothetical protein ST47_g6123 [Ascochyta rabiei]|uniref:Uncharacterized protein n=1 Tax=Didymella rabiei TaxID=5454 RepID=A0A163CUQ5_DIDRA|nr:hypothetical protein ST47_g6123 [Ascochyta rabiei]
MTDTETPINAEDYKVGPIPLPWFIPLCIFIPTFLTMLVYFIYLHTIKKHQDKKRMAAQDEEAAGGGTKKEDEVSPGVEAQVRKFMEVEV